MMKDFLAVVKQGGTQEIFLEDEDAGPDQKRLEIRLSLWGDKNVGVSFRITLRILYKAEYEFTEGKLIKVRYQKQIEYWCSNIYFVEDGIN
jgi:hypothetical protein